jgi:ATP-dependent RNA helicase SUPV3L1/SUV3
VTKQIAGRAGRLASEYEIGRVATSFRKDRRALETGLNAPLPSLQRAGIYPEQELFEAFAEAEAQGADEPTSFVEHLTRFATAAKGTEHFENFFLCRQESTIAIAKLLDRVDGLSIKDRYSFCMSPASTTDLRIQAALWQFASRLARHEAVEMQIDPGTVAPRTPSEMRDFETAHAVVSLWMYVRQL